MKLDQKNESEIEEFNAMNAKSEQSGYESLGTAQETEADQLGAVTTTEGSQRQPPMSLADQNFDASRDLIHYRRRRVIQRSRKYLD